MALQLLFDGTLSPSTGTLTNRFSGATGFYIDAPNLNSEMEIDVFLQVYIATQAGEVPRNLPLGKLKDGIISLNETDTETIEAIPSEFIESGLEMAFFFTPSDAIDLDVWLVIPDCNLCAIDTRLSVLETSIEDRFIVLQNQILTLNQGINTRFNTVNTRLSAIESLLNQILTAVNTPDIPVITPAQTLFLIS